VVGARERDLACHLAALSDQVSGLPTAVSRLLEAAVQHLEAARAGETAELKANLETAAAAVKETGMAVEEGEAATRAQLRSLQQLAEELAGGVRRQVDAGREVARRQDLLAEEVRGVREELRRQAEQVVEAAGARRVPALKPGRRAPAAPRPPLTPTPGPGIALRVGAGRRTAFSNDAMPAERDSRRAQSLGNVFRPKP
jgi:hypothetical protein